MGRLEKQTYNHLEIMKPAIHKAFKINGKAVTNREDLLAQLIKLDKSSYEFVKSWLDDSKEVELKTSGSTGKPKRVSIEKKRMLASASATVKTLNLLAETKALLCLSSSYVAGKMMWVRALTYGWHLDWIKPTTALEIADTQTFDFVAMVPMQLEANRSKLHLFKKIIVGGGPVKEAYIQSLKKLSIKIWSTYGMTETVSHVALRMLYPKKETHYKALQGVTFKIDSRGCLLVSAPHLDKDLFITNDLIDLKDELHFVWKGRIDFIINSGGVKLSPEVIEAKLQKHLDKRVLVVGRPDEVLGETVTLLVETTDAFTFNYNEEAKVYEKGHLFLDDLKKIQLLDMYEIPKAIHFVSDFVETETKKIQRQKTLDSISFEQNED